jgi:hypothetical protein
MQFSREEEMSAELNMTEYVDFPMNAENSELTYLQRRGRSAR